MFGLRRRKAIDVAAQASSQLVKTCGAWSGLPPGFWQDAYVLGFLSGTIIVFAEMVLGKKPQGEELGHIIIGTYERLNSLECSVITRRISALQTAKDPDYLLAVANAIKTVAVTYGHPGFANDTDVIAATELGRATRGIALPANQQAEVGGALQTLLFYDVVRNRLGDGARFNL
jgi:hypothetical protein